MSLSDAVSSSRVASVVGYKITKGNFSPSSPNLPQRIALFGEANAANQSSLDTTPTEITSAQQAGELYGYGSPIHMAMRILRPISGSGIGGIPVYVYAQEEAAGATAKIMEINPFGPATGNGVHTVKVAGRSILDGVSFDISIVEGDDASDISGKIADAINASLGVPFNCNDSTYSAIFTSKWKGLTAEDLTLSVDTNGDDLGVTYTIETVQSGSGTPSIASALDFGETWNTLVLNTYGTVSSIMTALENYNGIADPDSPTGRYTSIVMKPFIALTGSTADDPSSITDARSSDMTIAICPAPGSDGHPLEAAANMCVLFATQMQDNPHRGILKQQYLDMPVPSDGDIGSMADYENRDSFVKKGCSTVTLSGGKYTVEDFVTTYHPAGENPPQFRYCRNIIGIDLNVFYGYYLLEQAYVVGATIANNSDAVQVNGVIKPKQWKQTLSNYFEDLVSRGLIADLDFTLDSLQVSISDVNPTRLETFFRYKRTSTARISSTTAQAGFNFGS